MRNTDDDEYVIKLYDNEQHNKLVIDDIKQHDLHQYVHLYNDVEPPTFHHHHGAKSRHDIVYHNHDYDDPSHDHDIDGNDLYPSAASYVYGPAVHDHDDDDGAAGNGTG